MIIQRTVETGLLPEATYLLQQLHDVGAQSYHTYYDARHPLGIYNISTSEVWSTFKKVLDQLDCVLTQNLFSMPPPDRSVIEPLLEAQGSLISAINRHFDDCELILRCFYAPSIEIDDMRKQPEVKESWDLVYRQFRKLISKIWNHVKHHHGRLCFIAIAQHQLVIPGYYVEGADSNGVVGPHEKIHEMYHDSVYTAFSFYRDLRFLIWGMYFTSLQLSEALQKITTTTLRSNGSEVEYSGVMTIAKRISELPLAFYPDEQKKAIPTVTIDFEGDNPATLTVSYPDVNAKLLSYFGKLRIMTSFRGDGVTQKFNLPYK